MAPSPSQPVEHLSDSNTGAWGAWKKFWFTPADPTLLGLLRLCTGLLAAYTIIGYTFDLQGFFGKDGLVSLPTRRLVIDQFPVEVPPINMVEPADLLNIAVPKNTEQQQYVLRYKKRWGAPPPVPFPMSKSNPDKIDRIKEKEINDYRAFWGADPRLLYARGTTEWSIWFHVTDPPTMTVLHIAFIIVSVMFTLGFCTRITTVLTWFALICYVHRSPATLFGVDTMLNIAMIYMMIGPAGAALSVDAWLKRWWASGSESATWLKRFLRYPESDEQRLAENLALGGSVKPSVAANFAVRALQIHVCIIYAAAGLSKLKGNAWWDGTAVWHTLSNFEFAPMESSVYLWLLSALARQNLLLNLFIASGTYFTLFFEICYPFLIWGRKTRWLMLSMALILHGFIGTLMGLKTFALMMVVMNMAFLPAAVTHWLVNFCSRYWVPVSILVLWPFVMAFMPEGITLLLEDYGYQYWLLIICLVYGLMIHGRGRDSSEVSQYQRTEESGEADQEGGEGNERTSLPESSSANTGVLVKKKTKRKGKSKKKEMKVEG